MAGTAYHMEALRKARLNERKTDAVRKLQDSLGQGGAEYVPISVDENPEPLVFSEPGQYLTNRCPNVGNKDVVFEEVVHDPNYRYRLLKQSGNNPIHVDPIYKIMYPGGQIPRKLTSYKIGTVRDMKQYDHSRRGPIVDKTNYQLRREFNFLGDSLAMLKNDVIPANKPMPKCRSARNCQK